MPVIKQTVSLPEEIVAAMGSRGDRLSTEITRNLNRYLYSLFEARREMRSQFGDQECGLILSATNGTMFSEPFSISLIHAGVEDAIRYEKLDDKWGVDGPALVGKLAALTYIQKLALVDAVNVWWNGNNAKADPEWGALLSDHPDDATANLFIG